MRPRESKAKKSPSSNPPTVLLTGGAGFIGSHLARHLVALDWTVVVLDDLSTGKAENLLDLDGEGNFRFVEGSILDGKTLRKLIARHHVALISHQAARPSVARSVEDPERTTAVNVAGTVSVLKAAVDGGVRRVVAASSSSIYGDTPELPKHEGMPLNPKSPYAASKAAGELYLRAFHSVYGLETIGLRYFNVYGARQDPQSQYAAVIPRFVTAAFANKPLEINGDGQQTRDFSYIADVLAANLLALQAPTADGFACNIAYGRKTSVLDLASRIIALTGSKSSIVHAKARAGDVRDSLAHLGVASERLGYRPQWPLERGLAETVAWYRSAQARREQPRPRVKKT